MPQYPGFDIATFKLFIKPDGGKTISNTFYWQFASTALTDANANQACQSFYTQISPKIQPFITESTVITAVTVRVFKQGGLIDGIYTGADTGLSTSTESMPMQDAMVIQKRCSAFGRSARGRYFFGGLSEDVNVNGELSNASRIAAKALADFLGADRTFVVPMHARHWDRKNNQFLAITSCKAVIELKSRRDRQTTRGSTVI